MSPHLPQDPGPAPAEAAFPQEPNLALKGMGVLLAEGLATDGLLAVCNDGFLPSRL